MSIITILLSCKADVIEPAPVYVMTQRSTAVTDFVRDGTKLMQIGNYVYSFGGWDVTGNPTVYNDVYRSSGNLNTWTKRANAPWSGRHTYGIGKIGDTVYIFGADFYNATMDCWATDDGEAWVQKTANMGMASRILYGACWHDEILFMIGGQFGLTTQNGNPSQVYRSGDGVNWSQAATGLTQFNMNIIGHAVSFSGKIWVVSGGHYDDGTPGNDYTNDVWSSPDGVTWTQEADFPGAARFYSDMVVWDNKLWVIAGYNASGNLSDIWYMKPNGVWVQFTTPGDFLGRHATGVCSYTDANGVSKLVITNGNYHNDCWVIEKQ